MERLAVVTSVPKAMKIIKEMKLRGYEWGEGYQEAGRDAIKKVLEQRMELLVAGHLDQMASEDLPDRRNGTYGRHLLTELGDIALAIPRTRTFSAQAVVRAYARRSRAVDRAILACFVLGLSTRKVAQALLPVLGEPVSAATVSRIAKALDDAVLAFHARRLRDTYPVLLFDGVVLARKTGMGALRRPVLVALGIRPDGKKEVLDFWLAGSESEAEWRFFLSDLFRRGLEGAGAKLIAVDGNPGLRAALREVYPFVPVQRCWAHKTRNVLDKVRKAERNAVKKDLQRISRAAHRVEARGAARAFADRWEESYPAAVRCLREDLDELLTFFAFDDPDWRKASRTTNAIERRFREVRRRTRPMGVFADKTSMERILFAVFANENCNQGSDALFLLTQKS